MTIEVLDDSIPLRRASRYALVIIIAALTLRALLLELTSLIDPTETRYASIAQEMLLSGDWLTPKLHLRNGIEPYHGKPPLYFWLTGGVYALFGVDEWTSRLPSFLTTLLALAVLGTFAARLFDRDIALSAVLITYSSALLFFVSGGCITDTALSAFVTLSIALLYLWYSGMDRRSHVPLYAAAACALGFLSKGPVALVLTGLPFAMWGLLRGEFRSLFRLPLAAMSALFVLIAAPWFVLSEAKYPGFSRYFFLNENFARFLVHEYGDRYGTGHVYIHGFAWIFLALGFMPWTPVLVLAGIAERRNALARLRACPHILFLICWAFSTPAFFTFARQLHALYILPAIPPLGILCALAIRRLSPVETTILKIAYGRTLTAGGVLAAGAVLATTILSGMPAILPIAAAAVVIGLHHLKHGAFEKSPLRAPIAGASIAFAAFLATIVLATPFVNATRSGEPALKLVLNLSKDKTAAPRVAITSTNAFSHYWLSDAWIEELGRPVDVRFLPIDKIAQSDVDYVVLRNSKDVPKEVSAEFEIGASSGPWTVLRRRPRNPSHLGPPRSLG